METQAVKLNTKYLILTALFTALTVVGAYLRIPTPWSSFTLQILFVCMAGLLLGPKYGAASQIIYVLLGLIGMPIFSGGGGPAYIFHPTFGFLLGYIAAAFLVGLLCRRQKTVKRMALACVVGLAAIYVIGLPYMGWVLNVYMGQQFDFVALLWLGMIPFLPADALKIALAVVLSHKLLPALSKTA